MLVGGGRWRKLNLRKLVEEIVAGSRRSVEEIKKLVEDAGVCLDETDRTTAGSQMLHTTLALRHNCFAGNHRQLPHVGGAPSRVFEMGRVREDRYTRRNLPQPTSCAPAKDSKLQMVRSSTESL